MCALLAPWILLIAFPASYQILFAVAILSFAAATVSSVETAALAFVALSPLHGIVRSANPDALFLTIWKEILGVLLLVGWLLTTKRRMVSRAFQLIPTPLYLVVAIYLIQVVKSPDIPYFLAWLRQDFRFWALVPVYASCALTSPRFGRKVLEWMLVGLAACSVLHLLAYYDLWQPYTAFGTDTTNRTVLGFDFKRLAGLGYFASSGLVDALAPGVVISLLLAISRRSACWMLVCLCIWSAGFLTLSHSLLIVISLGFGALVLWTVSLQKRRMRPYALLIYAITPICVLALLFAGIIGESSEESVWARIRDEMGVYVDRLPLDTFGHFLIGDRLLITGVKGVAAEHQEDVTELVDSGYASVVRVLGVPAGSFVLCCPVWIAWRAVRAIRMRGRLGRLKTPYATSVLGLMLVAYISSFGAIHIVPWSEYSGPDVTFVALAGCILGLGCGVGQNHHRVVLSVTGYDGASRVSLAAAARDGI